MYNSYNLQEIAGFLLHYSSASVKTTAFNRYEDTARPPQCHNFDSTAGAGGLTAGAAAPAVNMLEEALHEHTVNAMPAKQVSLHISLGKQADIPGTVIGPFPACRSRSQWMSAVRLLVLG